MTIESLLQEFQGRADRALDRWLPPANIQPQRLHEAMRYSALAPGKRIRPALVYLTGQALGVPLAALDGPATAVELIHAYSLVHDDLPAMDDDDLRRGRPTCHKQFDEATAILVGDGLQALAFYVLARDPEIVVDAMARLAMVERLALAAGSRGMVGGQALDLAAVGLALNQAELENMHIHKTGALIRVSVLLGLLSAPTVTEEVIERLDHYAKCIGLAFQVRDDILDVEGDTAVIGKPQGSDRARDKPTFPDLLGLEEAKRFAEELYQEACKSLAELGPGWTPHQEMADFIVGRNR
jgi:farnesyl diphosphate synthase